MPILRTYMCPDCAMHLEVTLSADEWEAPPPDCPRCNGMTHQDFKPIAIGGSVAGRAAKMAETIATEDYHVADMNVTAKGQGDVPSVRYKDTTSSVLPSTWGSANQEMLEGAASLGRETRLRYGNGLDVLQHALKTGSQPDLIEISKRRSMRVG